jgi:hypothetical protein
VTLKVKGSSPFIHPILKKQYTIQLWELTPPTINFLNYKACYKNNITRLIILKWLISMWGTASCNIYNQLYYKLFSLPPLLKSMFLKHQPLNRNFEFKNSPQLPNQFLTSKLPSSVKIPSTYCAAHKLISSFKSFTKVNTSSIKPIFKTHHSAQSLYLNSQKGSSSILNISKFFHKWKLAYYLCFNIFFITLNLWRLHHHFLKMKHYL